MGRLRRDFVWPDCLFAARGRGGPGGAHREGSHSWYPKRNLDLPQVDGLPGTTSLPLVAFQNPPNCRLSDWRGTAIRGGAPAFGVAAFEVGREVQIAGPIVEKADASRRRLDAGETLTEPVGKGERCSRAASRKTR
jgi:hypothetical protein